MKTTNFFYFFYTSLISTLFIAFSASAETAHVDSILSKDNYIEDTVRNYLTNKIYKQLPKKDHNGVNILFGSNQHHKRLKQCDEPLTLIMHGQKIKRNASVKVSCSRPHAWSIYVTAKISLELPVISLSKELPKRHILSNLDLTSSIQDIYSLRDGYSTDANDFIGKELKRPLKSGTVLYGYHLQSPEIIKKGDRVTVVINRGGFSVMNNAVALSNASEGDRIRVENERSSRILQALVIGPGQVMVQ